jgi:thioredoxin-dependent peroxiredoxin
MITFQGNPLTLNASPLKVGDAAPATTLIDNGLAPVSAVEAGSGKKQLFVFVPSFDTPVCSIEGKKFNDAVAAMGDTVAAYGVSADLPFAQGRWAKEADCNRLQLLSDYKTMDTARAWGLYIEELGLFARAVYVVDESGKVSYAEVVGEIAHEPNYDAALDALK